MSSSEGPNTPKKHAFYILCYFKSFRCNCFSQDAKWPHLKSTSCFNITSFLQPLNTDQLQFPSDHATQRLKRKRGIVVVGSHCEEKEVLTILSLAPAQPGERLKGTSGWTRGKSFEITPYLASVETNI